MRAMQRAVFDIPDPFLNPRVNCDALPGVDLDLWKERVTCKGGRRVERDSVADYPQNWDLMIKRAGMGYFWLCLCTFCTAKRTQKKPRIAHSGSFVYCYYC